ncbi:MAG TPA: methyltransferase domain-containing protein [Pseudoduganella sp.]
MMNSDSAVPGTEGYIDDAEWLIPRYEGVSFEDKYKAVLHLLPASARSILDLGAGTGVDSAWLARQGHKVAAVEPVAALRDAGIRLHAPLPIEWIDDSLPDLAKMASREASFDLVLVSAVWHHLAPAERNRAMSRIAALMKPGATLVMSVRHGHSPANRRVFEVSTDDTIDLALLRSLRLIETGKTHSQQLHNRQAGVTWTWLAFHKCSSLLRHAP